jgi:hypothetical protein
MQTERLGYTFYPKDYISDPDVMMMTPSQRGIYRDLIDLAYMSDNKIKYTLEQLSKYCNAKTEEIEEIIKIKGKKVGENYTIPSCDKRISKALVNRANGAKGGAPKKPKNNPNHNPNNNPNRTQTERQREREREREKENIGDTTSNDSSNYSSISGSLYGDPNTRMERFEKLCMEKSKEHGIDFMRLFYNHYTKIKMVNGLRLFLFEAIENFDIDVWIEKRKETK